VSGVALLITIILAGVALHVRWTAARQSVLAQRFGQDVEKMDNILRVAHLMPLHDTRPERRMVLDRISSLEADLKVLGRAGQGPGHYALGRAWLSLRDYRKARQHLELAWNGCDYRQPEVAYALGLTLASLFQQETEAAERIPGRESRERRKSEIEKEYREPARALLIQSRGASLEAPEYLEAMLALMEKRYDVAVQKADAAGRKIPSLYEAKKLVGDVHMSRGREARAQARWEDARKACDRAGAAYAEAAAIGQSDEGVLAADAARWIALMGIDADNSASPVPYLQAALAACDRAIAANPDASRAYLLKAVAQDQLGYYLMYHTSEDPVPALEQSVQFAREALTRSPDDAEGFRVIGLAYGNIATYRVDRLQDPAEPLQLSIEALNRARDLNPRDAEACTLLGNAYWNIGAHQGTRGEDPQDAYRKAEQEFARALEIEPTNFPARGNLAGLQTYIAGAEERAGRDPIPRLRLAIQNAEKAAELRPTNLNPYMITAAASHTIGRFEMAHGIDPSESLRRAAESYRKANRVDPTAHYVLGNLGNVLVSKSRYQMAIGMDPHGTLSEAVAAYDAALRLDPTYSPHLYGLAEACGYQALHGLQHAVDPSAALEKARRALREAATTAPDDFQTNQDLGWIELLSARATMQRGSSPATHFARSLEALQRSAGTNAGDAETFVVLAELYRWKAESQKGRSAESLGSIRLGIESADRALAIKPTCTDAMAAKGALLLQRARLTKTTTDIGAAHSLLSEALRTNPLLRPEYQAVLDECTPASGR